MKNIFLLSAVCVSLMLAKTIDFDTALKEALNNNLELKAKKLEIKKAKLKFEQAKGLEFGKLVFSEELSRSNNALYVFGMKLESREANFKDFGFSDFLAQMPGLLNGSVNGKDILLIQPNDLNNPGSRTNFKTKFVYEVPLFTGFKLKYAKKMAKLQILANKYKYSHDKNKLAIEVLKAYNGAVAAKYFVKALKSAKKTAKLFIKMVEAFYKEGMATKVDLLQVKKRYSEINSMLIEAENRYKLALVYLQFLIDDNTINDVKEFKVIIPNNISLNELEKLALKNRNDLKWMKENVKTMNTKIKFDKSEKYPIIGAHLEYGWNDNSLTLNTKKDYYLAAVGLKWNIFSKNIDAKIQESKVAAMQTNYYYKYMKKGILLDVRQKYLNLITKRSIVKEKVINKELAQEILKKYTYMYKQGLITVPILLLKEAEDRRAKAELIKAKYDQTIAAAELKAAIGDLIKEIK